MKPVLLLLFFIPAANCLASGQEPAHSFDELRKKLTIGDEVRIVDSGG